MNLSNVPVGPFDAVIFVAVVVSTRVGYKLGFGEAFWSLLQWGLAFAAGTLSWAPLGQEVSAQTGWALNVSAVLVYAAVGTAAFIGTSLARRLFGERLLLAMPPGPADGLLGAAAGAGAALSGAMIFFALLNPFEITNIDWNPLGMKNEDAITSLSHAIFGSLRNAAFDTSWVGQTLQQNFKDFLIQSSLTLPPDPATQI